MKLPESRIVNLLGVALSAGSLAFAFFYLEGVLELEACPLCLIDRALIAVIGAAFLIGLLLNPQALGRRIQAGVALLFSLFGIIVCWRHLWLQGLPEDEVPECSPGLGYMLETFPIGDTIRTVFNSAGECADIQWNLLGLSIPAQTLLVFIALGALAAVQTLRRKP